MPQNAKLNTSMSTDLTKEIAMPEIKDLQGLADGCNGAIVTYGLRPKFSNPNDLEVCKMVILYNRNELDFETIKSGADEIMMRQSFSLVKSVFYHVIGNIASRLSIQFRAILFRNIIGYTPNDQIHDDRKKYNNYQNGRA